MIESLAIGDTFVSKIQFLYAPPNCTAPMRLRVLAVDEKTITVEELYPQESDLGQLEWRYSKKRINKASFIANSNFKREEKL